MPILKATLDPRPAGPRDHELHSTAWLPRALGGRRARRIGSVTAAVKRRPELVALIGLAGVLNLWALGRNGWANTYYAAADRSMSTSWHDFLFASLDRSGVMSVDKPPLALWVQALSVRMFGYHPLSILIPEALIGVVTVVLLYDLVRRVFGRVAGLVAGFALATTPITVAMSRHNNPDALLVLCCVAAVWFVVRAFEDGRTRWIVWAGVMVGLGFETKMGVALVVAPGIVVAWLWVAPRGLGVAVRQLLAGGAAMLAVGGAWPALVWLTPAADRPWVSGTANNSIFSLIFGYNGLGRVDGQTGGPAGLGGGGAGGVFGGGTGPFRLLNDALGGQDGWLLGVALVGGIAILVTTRLRRGDPRSGWLIAVAGSFLAAAVLFSIAKGIFHPYYVSLLAPFTAALVGASAGQLIAGKLGPRIVAVCVVAAGVACELVVLGDYPGQLAPLHTLLIIVGVGVAIVLLIASNTRVRAVALAAALAVLLVAPTIWAFDTLGYKTQGTFPSGGPSIDDAAANGGGGLGGFARRGGLPGFAGSAGPPAGAGAQQGAPGAQAQGGVGALFGSPGPGRSARRLRFGRGGFFGGRGAFGGGGAFGGDTIPAADLAYTREHGGGTIAVASQGTAANEIIDDDANVAGIGGFSGRESDPTVSWFAQEVRSGKIRWVLNSGSDGFSSPSDSRPGATVVLSAAATTCTAVSTTATTSSGSGTLYDCAGKAAALAALA
jgi:4-amino-4-deoxy-L-arabinose transferase-like glycosyltransferase